MLYEVGRAAGRVFAGAPILSSIAVIGLIVLVDGQCSSSQGDDAQAVIAAERRAAATEELRAREELARREAAKSPEQRASEAAAKAAEARAAQIRREQEDKRRQAREAEVAKAAAGIDKLPWWKQCVAWGRELRRNRSSASTEAYYRAIHQAGLINYADEVAVAAKERLPRVGMTGCGAAAILGGGFHTNVTANAFGTRVQMVYREQGVYVYTEGRAGDHNGIVTSVQY